MRSEHLVKAMKIGQLEAFEELYASYFQKVYFFALKICKSREAAEEITHDTFVTIWQKRQSLMDDIPIDGLIFKITKDASLKQLQKIARKYVMESNLQQTNGELDNSTINQIEYKERLGQVEEAMEKLPPKRRKIFEKRVLDHQSIQSISQDLGISENTTKTQLQKATKFVREQLRNSSL